MHGERRCYCLFCYAPMERIRGASAACERCGEVNLREDRRSHWTRERRLVRIEGLLKAWAVIVALAIAFPLLFVPRGMHAFSGVGYAVGAPILVGFLLWDAASLVTARRALLRHDLIWPLLPVTLIAGPALLFGAIGLITARSSQAFEQTVLAPIGLILLIGLPALRTWPLP